MAETRTCSRCPTPLTGTGANNAVLCVRCWAAALAEYEQGEKLTVVAQKYGVSVDALWKKEQMYGKAR